MKFDEIKVGDSAEIRHKITKNDIDKFVDLTGDDNKLHIDDKFAADTNFKKPVVHGMLGASFISTVIGTKLPGDGALWFSQSLDFLLPVRVGDEITITATVVKKIERDYLIELETDIYNQHKQKVTTGRAKVKVVEYEQAEDTKEDKAVVRRKTALILGASGGIGREVALKLANEGYDLYLHYNSNETAILELKEKLAAMNIVVYTAKANLLDKKDIDSFLSKLKRKFAYISVFVNCMTAKIPTIKLNSMEWEDIQNHISINVQAAFYVLKEIVPAMEAHAYGKIIFLTTQAIETPSAGWLHYITAKSALAGFAKSMAIELAPKGIMVNMVSPGMTDTDLVADIPQKAKMLLEAKTPLKRLAKVGDVANAIVFLASEKSDFITGETMRVNGGQVMI